MPKANGSSRRAILASAAAFAAEPAIASTSLPDRSSFEFSGTYLNAAFTHPMSTASASAVRRYVDFRLRNRNGAGYDMAVDRNACRTAFARLIRADEDEISFVPSTMVGENIIAAGLGLTPEGVAQKKLRVVTDAYHFEGSLYLYGELAKRGLEVEILRPKANGIALEDLARAITPGTTLVALSQVSMINGFQHDLKAVCDLAHARGALVYADIIQAAGAVPVDVRATGVDFCATATYKWLMGDFGVGFLYTRRDRQQALARSQYGYRQLDTYTMHVFPHDPAGDTVMDWTPRPGAGGRYEVGTLGNGAVAGLRVSLERLLALGVDRIAAHRQPLLDRLQEELPRYGFQPMTPKGHRTSIISFAYENATKTWKAKLDKAQVNIQLYDHRVRISPSYFNGMEDVEALLRAIAG